MKRNFKFVLVSILSLVTLLPFLSYVRYSPGVPAQFGVHRDVISVYSKNIISSAIITSDWFKQSANDIVVIDTTRVTGITNCDHFFLI